MVEAVAFIPFTRRSELNTKLQKMDGNLSETLKRPMIRFVERGGLQI